MSEMLTSQKINFQNKTAANKTTAKTTTVQLTFHIPEGMKNKLLASETINETIKEELEELKKLEALKIVEALKKIEAIKAVENLEVAEVKYVGDGALEKAMLPQAIQENVQEKIQDKIHNNELVEDVFPFLSLKLANQQAVYKIGSSYLQDINKGHKHFGFANLAKSTDERHVLAYAAFINYSIKQPVLVVVKDINDKSLNKFRSNFSTGTLWKWKTHEWGNLCLVDYKEINKHAEDLNNVDLSFITHEFSAVLWTIPGTNVQDELQRAALPILGKLDSVTFIISKGETKNKSVQKSASYFQCFSIPLKGILVGEEVEEV